MIKLAPIALLTLAIVVPTCAGTVWGNLLLLAIAGGIFLGTIHLGGREPNQDL